MATFKVLVVGPETVREMEDTLAPYNEHLKFPPYIKFTRQDKKLERKRLLKYWRKQVKERPNDIGAYNKLVELQGMDDEDYFLHCTRFYSSKDLNTIGEPISTYNPNSRWSTWDYRKVFRIKNTHGAGPQATGKKRHIDWGAYRALMLGNSEMLWDAMQDKTDEQKKLCYDWWGEEKREDYITRRTMCVTPAYVKNGVWHERGVIGWWGNFDVEGAIPVSEWVDEFVEMLDKVDDMTVINMIECNI